MARSFKILSDFDGVWTNQYGEAEEVVRFTADSLVELSALPETTTRERIAGLLERLKREPHEHGWAPDGRITAFVDEDPLCQSSALCRMIDQQVVPEAGALRAGVLSKWGSMIEFSEHCFITATQRYMDSGQACMIPDAADAFRAIAQTGAELVILSNSPAEKITRWFTRVGIDPAELRARGSAAKWRLGEGDESIAISGRTVFVDRPLYRAAIEAEDPDLIIGDVLSLDLALPHQMRSEGVATAPTTLVLRRHAHTPEWACSCAAVDHVVQGVADLPELIRTLV